MSNETILWIVFAIIVPAALLIDLLVFHRKDRKVEMKEALIWSAIWISLALIFAALVFIMLGHEKALLFITGYLVEESLSVDNLFVFLLIFTYFGVSAKHQHPVLFWGIVGAVVMRGIFIITGITLLNHLHWVIYIFGAFLVYTGIRLISQKDEEIRPEHNPILKLFRRFVPLTKRYHGHSFFRKARGKRLATPLLMVLVVVETTDIIFAMDSVPAILSITRDTFIVYTSNIFAILGLRSLYFALAGVIQRLRFLNYGLSAILVFLGVKMIISSDLIKVHIPIGISLGTIAGILAISALASFIWPEKKEDQAAGEGKE
jgi:tellurite resistance protein TerC